MGIRKAVFPAAGHGTRFLPATKASPKEMLPLVDKPLIQYCVEEVVESGISDIIIVTGRGKHTIEDHFDISYELEELLKKRGNEGDFKDMRQISEMADYFYVRQKMPLGLGHAVSRAKDLVSGEDFVVVLGDDIIKSEVPVTAQLLEAHSNHGEGIYLAVERVDPNEASRYGIVKPGDNDGNVFQVLDMVEKPAPEEAPSNLAIIGRYILPSNIFEHIEKTPPGRGGEIQLTDAMRSMTGNGKVFAVEFEGRRFDAGNKFGFLEANIIYALDREDLAEDVKRLLLDLVTSGFEL